MRQRKTLLAVAIAVGLFTLFGCGDVSGSERAVWAVKSDAAVGSPQSFELHLECEDGKELDIVVPSGGSYAGLVEDTGEVSVLKGIDFDSDGVPEFLVAGFTVEDLTTCAAFSSIDGEPTLVFTAFVLFAPQA